MKKALLVLLTLVLCLSLASSALPAGVKPPKSAAFTLDGNPLMMTFTSAGKINTADGQVGFYNIGGTLVTSAAAPLTGNGYVKGDYFHFSFVASTYFTGDLQTYLYEGQWNLTTARTVGNYVGDVEKRLVNSNGVNEEFHQSLLWADSATMTIP